MRQGKYKKNDQTYLSRRDFHKPKDYFTLLVRLIRGRSGSAGISLLDVGCAAGAFLSYARQQLNITSCVGIDVAEKLIKRARKSMPDAHFFVDSLERPQVLKGQEFDVCTCLGTLSLFDELEPVLKTLMSFVAPGGVLLVYDLVNDEPVDVLMRGRIVSTRGPSNWWPGYNVRSLPTWRKAVRVIGGGRFGFRAVAFRLSLDLPRTKNPMRAWTIWTEANPHQIVVGTGQLLNFKVLEIRKPLARRRKVGASR